MNKNILEIGGKKLDINKMNPRTRIKIGNRYVRVGQIPHDVYTLDCGHKGPGFGVEVGEIIFCDKCTELKAVSTRKR